MSKRKKKKKKKAAAHYALKIDLIYKQLVIFNYFIR